MKQTTMSTLEANAILLIDSKRRKQTKHYSKHISMETTGDHCRIHLHDEMRAGQTSCIYAEWATYRLMPNDKDQTQSTHSGFYSQVGGFLRLFNAHETSGLYLNIKRVRDIEWQPWWVMQTAWEGKKRSGFWVRVHMTRWWLTRAGRGKLRKNR